MKNSRLVNLGSGLGSARGSRIGSTHDTTQLVNMLMTSAITRHSVTEYVDRSRQVILKYRIRQGILVTDYKDRIRQGILIIDTWIEQGKISQS